MRINLLQGPFLPVPPLRGGAVEKMWYELGPEFVARGHQVTHVSCLFGGLPVEETRRGVRHLRVKGAERAKTMPVVLLQHFLFTRRAVRRLPPADVTVTNTFWAPVLLKPSHGALYVDVQRMPKGQLRLYRRAARLRANSSAVRDAIVAEAPDLASRVRVIPNPLSFTPGRGVDWARKTKKVLFVGRIHPEKGIELLLEAWSARRAAGQFDGWQLELVGPASRAEGGGGEDWVRGLQARFRRPDIMWRGAMHDPEQLNACYEEATVFAYPSVAAQGETFGVAVIEAMAWGAVPVVSNLACFRDFVRADQNGLIFEHASPQAAALLGAALERAARPESRALGEAAVGVRETHSCSSIATQFLEDFARLR